MSLGRSGTVPIGKGFPQKKASDPEEVAPGMVNLQLMVSMPSGGGESYGAFCTSRPEKLGEVPSVPSGDEGLGEIGGKSSIYEFQTW